MWDGRAVWPRAASCPLWASVFKGSGVSGAGGGFRAGTQTGGDAHRSLALLSPHPDLTRESPGTENGRPGALPDVLGMGRGPVCLKVPWSLRVATPALPSKGAAPQ